MRYGTRQFDHYGRPIEMSRMEIQMLKTNQRVRRSRAKNGWLTEDR
jgi:hypothetical protein